MSHHKNIGAEPKVFIAKSCQYYHLKKDCPIMVENVGFAYKQVRISQVKNHRACPKCVENFEKSKGVK